MVWLCDIIVVPSLRLSLLWFFIEDYLFLGLFWWFCNLGLGFLGLFLGVFLVLLLGLGLGSLGLVLEAGQKVFVFEWFLISLECNLEQFLCNFLRVVVQDCTL